MGSLSVVLVLALATAFGALNWSRDVEAPVVGAAVTALDALGLLNIEQAERSLEQGQGPAAGAALNCTLSGFTLSGQCSSVASASGPVASAPHPDGNCSIELQVIPSPASPHPACSATPLTWQGVTQPGARELMSIAYDKADRYTLAFGGWNGTTYFADTWEFVKGKWIPLNPKPPVPSPRYGASMAYDSKDGYILLFGGRGADGLLDDTWSYHANKWTQMSTPTAPSPRSDAAMADDVTDGYVVLFGGWNGSATLSDTWEFADGAWTQVIPHPPGGKTTWSGSGGSNDPSQGQNTSYVPRGREDAGITYDSRDGVILMFGGANYSNSQVHDLNDTWYFSGGAWIPLSQGTAPPARSQAVFAFDEPLDESVLFGGLGLNGTTQFDDTWVLVGATWHLESYLQSPSARAGAAGAYDGNDSLVVVFSGNEEGLPAGEPDTWTFNGSWFWDTNTPVESWPDPSARYAASFVFDLADKDSVLFGGMTGMGTSGETWTFDDQQWVELFSTPSPSARSFAAMVYDAADGYVVLFGGRAANGTALGDTWTFAHDHWTQLFPTPAPSPRYGAAAVYDSNDSEVVLFGGTSGGGTYLGDTWAFRGGGWTEVSTSGGPSPRAYMEATYDGNDGYSLFYGGLNASGILGDTWEFIAGQWTQLAGNSSSVSPPARWGAVFGYDPTNNVVLLYAGCEQTVDPTLKQCNDIVNDTWRFSKGKWGPLATLQYYGEPAPVVEAYTGITAFALETTSPTEILVMQSGLTDFPTVELTNQRWLYSGQFTPWYPPDYPSAREGAPAQYEYKDDKIVMFGGYGPLPGGGLGYLNDTWEWDTYVWYPVFGASHPPSARAWGTLAFDAGGDEVIYFGGVGASGFQGDTWAFLGGPATGDWHKIQTTVAPAPRANQSMAWDNQTGQMVLFGGQNQTSVFGDTWVFVGNHSKGNGFYGNWTREKPSASPSPRTAASMIFDSKANETVLFGGYDPFTKTPTQYNDTWVWTGTTWYELSTPTAPSPRYGAEFIDDPQDIPGGVDNSTIPASAVLFGGENNGTYLGDTWLFYNNTWTLDHSAGTPPAFPTAFATIGNDETDGNVEMFGGTNGYPSASFWTFF